MAKKRGTNQPGGIAGERLRSYIERIERLEEEKRTIAADIASVFNEAKGSGFDTKTMRQILRLRRMGSAEREEFEALLDIYKAALGMLDGTPLGEAAVRRLSSEEPRPGDGKGAGGGDGDAPPSEAAGDPPPPSVTPDEARDLGRAAARNGEAVTANPFTARDPRRAAWDEGWCVEAGSDGMDIPAAWRRAKKPKKGDEGGAGAGAP